MVKTQITYNNSLYSFFGLYENDHIFKHLKNVNNFYEITLLEKIKSLNLGGTYVDVGANIGNHTIFFSEHCNSEKVVSIEISPVIFNVLKNNVNNNNLSKQISLINSGVGETSKNVTLSDIDKENVGMTKVLKDGGDVKILPLDDLLSEYKNISLIKLDVEGYELNAVKGAKRLLQEQSPILITELKEEWEFEEFKEFVSQYGYYTDRKNYAKTPTYIWKKEVFDFVYIIPTYERYDKLKSLIDSILLLNQNCKIIICNDASKDNNYKNFINYHPKLVYLENKQNNGKLKYWKTVNTLLNEMSNYNFSYGIMLADDLSLIKNFNVKLKLVINENDIIRLFTQKNISENWGYKNWIDGAFCAPYKFFKKINFELFSIPYSPYRQSSGVGAQMTKRLNDLNFKVLNFGSMVTHNGNIDSVMHPKYRLENPLEGEEFLLTEKLILTSNPIISVIIPTFNNIEFIEECLNSVISAGYGFNIEILVGLDKCNKTLEFLKNKKYDNRIKFYFFTENKGPYVIKNTLAKIATSDKILFFDSDDIMCDTMILDAIKSLETHIFYKPKYINFHNYKINSTFLTEKEYYGEGVFAIRKQEFLNLNGFEPWRCAADTDFMGRLYNIGYSYKLSENLAFYRRIHENSLTSSPITSGNSYLRKHYIEIMSNKNKSQKPQTLNTGNFVFFKPEIEDEVNSLMMKPNKDIVFEKKETTLKKIKRPYSPEEKKEITDKRNFIFGLSQKRILTLYIFFISLYHNQTIIHADNLF